MPFVHWTQQDVRAPPEKVRFLAPHRVASNGQKAFPILLVFIIGDVDSKRFDRHFAILGQMKSLGKQEAMWGTLITL